MKDKNLTARQHKHRKEGGRIQVGSMEGREEGRGERLLFLKKKITQSIRFSNEVGLGQKQFCN